MPERTYTPYTPISCVAHEHLEFAVLRRQRLSLCLMDEDGAEAEAEIVMPTDVSTCDGAEWLDYIRSDGQTRRVRLDRIVNAEPA